MNPPELQFRTAKVERANAETRTLELAFASAEPVHRGAYVEELDMSGLDLSRLNTQAPLLRNHDPEQQVGAVVRGSARVDADGMARASVKFSRSQAGLDALRDAEDGISGVSFGYMLGEFQTRRDETGNEIRRYRSTAFEISLVSIPADVSVGVGRSAINPRNMITTTQPADDNIERKRCGEILALSNKHGIALNVAQRFIAEGRSIDEFRNHILENKPRQQPIDESAAHDFTHHCRRSKYSLLTAIQSVVEERKLTGIEAEAHEELKKRAGGKAKGLWIPTGALAQATRTMTAGSAPSGGFLAPTEVLGGELIQYLRPASRVIALGARVMAGMSFDASIPKIVTGSAATWKPEATNAGETAPTFGQINLTKHAVTAYAELSKELILGSCVDAEALVRADFAAAIGQAIDAAAIAGTGADAQPLGLLNQVGTSTLTFSTAPTWAKVCEFETTLSDDNADTEGAALGFLSTPTVRAKWKTTVKVSSYPEFLLGSDGRANGYQFVASTNVPSTNLVIFGNWSELIIPMFAGLDVVIDPYTNARKRVVNITASQMCDIAVRHPESFVISTDSGAQ